MINKASKLLIVCSTLVLFSACQSTNLSDDTVPQSKNKYVEFIHSGDILPIKSMTTIEGKEVNLEHIGKKKLVILFATWCSDSNRLLKAMNNSPLLEDETIEVIAIAREEDKETVKKWRQAHNIKVPLAVDIDREIYKKFAAGGIPRIITVAENNKIIKMNLAEGNKQLKKVVWQ
jgi:peroxiredoxin